MADLNPKQFRMQTNIKAAPNSQGTLFQGGYPTRYPRGYTPERRDEVREAIGWQPHRLRGQDGRPAPFEGGGAHPDNVRAIETIARSTVPTDHLHGFELIAGQNSLAGMEEGTRGVYRKGYTTAQSGSASDIQGKRLDVEVPAKIAILKGVAETRTPIHEIGHHVSDTVEKTPHSPYHTPEQRGEEEGYAENYADVHFRDRRGRQERGVNTAQGWTRKDNATDKLKFQYAFDRKRRESPLAPAQFDHIKMTKKQQELPPEHISGQIPLLDKLGSTGEIEEYEGGHRYKPGPRRWDYPL